jgi:hypothetical protein
MRLHFYCVHLNSEEHWTLTLINFTMVIEWDRKIVSTLLFFKQRLFALIMISLSQLLNLLVKAISKLFQIHVDWKFQENSRICAFLGQRRYVIDLSNIKSIGYWLPWFWNRLQNLKPRPWNFLLKHNFWC